MGWSFEHRDKGMTNVAFFADKMGDRYEIVDGATVAGTFYAATRNRETGLVDCFVALTRWVPNDWFNFGYKDMSESMGPSEARCPARILDLLSPIEDLYGPELEAAMCDNHFRCEWAKRDGMYSDKKEHVNQRMVGDGAAFSAADWRRACRAYIEKKNSVKVGSIIRLRTASTGEYFQLIDKRRNVFRHVYQNAATGEFEPLLYTRTRIPWWRNGGYEVVA